MVYLPFVLIAALGLGVVLFGPWLKGRRTQLFHGLLLVLGGLVPLLSDVSVYLQTIDWTQYISDRRVVGVVVIGVAVTGLILRHLTTGPVGSKD
jgi:hypothetical protein